VPAPQINCGTPNWSHASDRQPYRLGGNSGATACADLDNDGDMDLYTGEIRHWWAGLGSDMSEPLINVGNLGFERPGREALGIVVEHVTGTSWDEGHMSLTTLDFDNDGRRDVYVGASDYPGNRGLLFHQKDTLVFEPVSIQDGFEHNRSHGVVTADFDRDGDLDLIVGHSRARCDASAPNDCYATPQIRAFENVYGDAGNWIALRLEGVTANRSAIGARVRVTAGGMTQTQEIGGGYGHYGAQDDLVLHFGLGDACEAQIEIRWPDQSLETQQLTLPGGHRFAISQGERATLDD
jgi:enediyne biosynthesis protein E4